MSLPIWRRRSSDIERRRDPGNPGCEVWSSAFTRRAGRNAVLGRLRAELRTETNPAGEDFGADRIVYITAFIVQSDCELRILHAARSATSQCDCWLLMRIEAHPR